MCEQSNANTLVALREARRKKILENSANRLKLIEGINSSHLSTSSETLPEWKPEPEVRETSTLTKEKPSSELNSKLGDLLKSNTELREISDFLLKDNDKVHEGEVEVEEEEEEEEEEDMEVGTVDVKGGNPFLKLFLQKRLHYVLLALAVNLLFLFNVGYLFYENIFCPFYSLKTIELISKKGAKEDFQPVLFLLVASLPKRVQKFTKIILTLLLALFSDLCIYLFAFVLGAKIINNQH